ncbi:LacI family DNA-binding transcriptional regulator [Leucobacter allii]|uniref:LacI family DNA-binding transcriptional regulator n=1 Tax=Leucobacter allii TaxID=2932247 RepID=A0ABY4FP31_9MICO|nr:LacI family DNA-binding transcriptional regulator [Leucobacter allii]UOQ58039.1 LacI family DNA-binding transcriptional regulator [Leucobacter allii]
MSSEAGRRASRRSTRSVTLAEVAEHAGVSPQTVSRAIRTPDVVSEDTLERVQASIRATGYVPNLAASNLASNRSNTIAVLIPAVSASVFADTVQGLDSVLAPHGYHLFIGTTEYSLQQEEATLRALLGRRPDGVVLVGTEHTPEAQALLAAARVPVVESWELTQHPVDSVVGFSNYAAMSALFEHVHALGYRCPVLAGQFAGGDVRALRRRAAFEDGMRRLYPGVPVRILDSGAAGVSLDAGRDLFRQVRSELPRADLIMFASDVFATGATLEAVRSGVAIPGELGITGFGGFEVGRHLVPQLTTMAIPSRRIGEEAGRVLLERIAAGGRQTGEARIVDVGHTLVLGESTVWQR